MDIRKSWSASPPFLALRDGKIEQMERVAAFFVCLSKMSSMAFQSGSPCYCRVVGWLAGSSRKTLSINVFDYPAVASLQQITPQISAKSGVAYGCLNRVVFNHLTSTQQAATLHICIPRYRWKLWTMTWADFVPGMRGIWSRELKRF